MSVGMMKSVLLLLTASTMAMLPTAPVLAQQSPKFTTEQEAARHCPGDTVVWLNSETGVYHFKGQRWFGRTKNGAYECRKEGDGEGDRATRNGQ